MNGATSRPPPPVLYEVAHPVSQSHVTLNNLTSSSHQGNGNAPRVLRPNLNDVYVNLRRPIPEDFMKMGTTAKLHDPDQKDVYAVVDKESKKRRHPPGQAKNSNLYANAHVMKTDEEETVMYENDELYKSSDDLRREIPGHVKETGAEESEAGTQQRNNKESMVLYEENELYLPFK